MTLPTVQQIRALHEKYAPTRAAFELVHTHCEIVSRIAEQLLARAAGTLDADLVRTGALLHDIGVYRLNGAGYIRHGILGHEILRDEGFPERLGRFCSCHVGVGLTRHDVLSGKLDVPVADYLAETAEEQLVMYADKFHTKSSPPAFLSVESYEAFLAMRFGPEKVRAFHALRERFGVPDLTALRAEYGHTQAVSVTLRATPH
ncbi:HDIG domain-containing metalloprotein [Streptomyces sp. NPDC049577]|uniref:HDIG domain-containing metalloprotein n=1 Tax=Streptomyces sp. NPDC049577 TaxID=3155153 RepID=UPI003448A5A4